SQSIGAGSDLGAGFEAELARHAVLRRDVVAPRAQQPRAVLVQRDRERAGLVVDVEREVRLPVAVERRRVRVTALRDAPEAHPLGVEEPDAVGRFDSFHSRDRQWGQGKGTAHRSSLPATAYDKSEPYG